MKLLFISEYFPPNIMGGGEINLFLLAKSLVKNNIEVSILTSYNRGLKKFEKVRGINVYRKLKTGKNPRGIFNNFQRSFVFPRSVLKEAVKLNKKIDFDFIHFIGTSVIAAEKLKRLKKKMFATIESYPALCPKGDRIYYGKCECKIKCSLSKFLSCQLDRKSTRLNSSHIPLSRMPSSA